MRIYDSNRDPGYVKSYLWMLLGLAMAIGLFPAFFVGLSVAMIAGVIYNISINPALAVVGAWVIFTLLLFLALRRFAKRRGMI